MVENYRCAFSYIWSHKSMSPLNNTSTFNFTGFQFCTQLCAFKMLTTLIVKIKAETLDYEFVKSWDIEKCLFSKGFKV